MSFENAGGEREPRSGNNLLTRIPVNFDDLVNVAFTILKNFQAEEDIAKQWRQITVETVPGIRG